MWARIAAALTKYLKGAAFKAAFLNLAKTLIVGAAKLPTVKAWLLNLILENLYEEIARPILNMALNRLGYVIEVSNGKELIKRKNEAHQNGNEDDYNNTIDIIFN